MAVMIGGMMIYEITDIMVTNPDVVMVDQHGGSWPSLFIGPSLHLCETSVLDVLRQACQQGLPREAVVNVLNQGYPVSVEERDGR